MPRVEHGGVTTYQMMAGRKTYDWADTRALLLLGGVAVRAAWHRFGGMPDGVRHALRHVMAVARGRRRAIQDSLYEPLSDVGSSEGRTKRQLATYATCLLVRAAGYGLTLRAGMHERGLWDPVTSALEDLLLACVVSGEGAEAADDERLLVAMRRAEIRCLIHIWTGTMDVVPMDVLRAVDNAGSVGGLDGARAKALAWRAE